MKNESKLSTQSITIVQNERKLLEKIKKRQVFILDFERVFERVLWGDRIKKFRK